MEKESYAATQAAEKAASASEREVEKCGSKHADEKEVMSNKKLILIVSSPLWAPCLMVMVIMLGMFIGCGWLFVAMTFFGSAAAAAVGICGIIGAIVNVANGIGAVLLALGCGFIGFSLIYPIFVVAKEYFKGFSVLSRDIFRKLKDMKQKLVNRGKLI